MKCSGRDLNPGSATRKATMLDRNVQHFFATTPPERAKFRCFDKYKIFSYAKFDIREQIQKVFYSLI
jgi:hypothetical protein